MYLEKEGTKPALPLAVYLQPIFLLILSAGMGPAAESQETQVIGVELLLKAPALTNHWDDLSTGKNLAEANLATALQEQLPHWDLKPADRPASLEEEKKSFRLVFRIERDRGPPFIHLGLMAGGKAIGEWDLSPVSPRDLVVDLWATGPEDLAGWILKRLGHCSTESPRPCGQFSFVQAAVEKHVPIGRGGRWMLESEPLVHLPLSRSRHADLEEGSFRLECIHQFPDSSGAYLEQGTRIFASGIRLWKRYQSALDDEHLVVLPTLLIAGGRRYPLRHTDSVGKRKTELELGKHDPKEVYLSCLNLDEIQPARRIPFRGRP